MKSREQFIRFAVIYACAWLIGMVMFGLAQLTVEIEWLTAIFSILGVLSLLFPVGIGFYAGVYSVLQFRNAYNAYVAGEDYNEYKTRIHYTLPFAFALGGFGFSFIGIALAIFLVWMLHKWARPIYDWNEMKGILLHRNGTSWKRTALTWVNVAFFVLVAIIPLVILGIIIGILYLLGKSGIIDGFFNMVTGTMGGGGGSGVSSAFNSCDNCAHYGVGGDGKCWHGYSNPAGRCPYYSEK